MIYEMSFKEWNLDSAYNLLFMRCASLRASLRRKVTDANLRAQSSREIFETVPVYDQWNCLAQIDEDPKRTRPKMCTKMPSIVSSSIKSLESYTTCTVYKRVIPWHRIRYRRKWSRRCHGVQWNLEKGGENKECKLSIYSFEIRKSDTPRFLPLSRLASPVGPVFRRLQETLENFSLISLLYTCQLLSLKISNLPNFNWVFACI